MLDIKVLRKNTDMVKSALKKRNKNYDETIDSILDIDEKRREILFESESLKAEQNKISKEFPKVKKEGGDIEAVKAKMRSVADDIKALEEKLDSLDKEQEELSLTLPNIPHESVPEGKDENDNIEIRRWGTPRQFPYEPKPHWELGESLHLLDPERAGKVTGPRFHFYKGMGARLERSVINYFLDTHTDNGYTELLAPFMVNEDSMKGTGQLPKFKEDMFKIEDAPYYMVPTAEVPVTNYHRDEILMADELPLKYCAYTPCFRNEKGASGRDTRGLIRQHQFNKVELVEFCESDKSYEELENLTREAEKVLQGLNLPYRVVLLSGGDLGFASAKTYDIEVWMPSYNRYVEISSCSCYEDFQSRRLSCRYKKEKGDKAKLLHTLNGSGVAVGRCVAAILENYQNDDGSVTVPEALRGFMGRERITK